MVNFIPGKIIHTFRSKRGDEIIIRYPKWEDLDELLRHVNQLSYEDTYVTLSGETITQIEETNYLSTLYKEIEIGDNVTLLAFSNDRLIASCGISRNRTDRRRGLHYGNFGLAVDNQFRGVGVGYEIAQKTIEEAKNKIQGLKIVRLGCFAKNTQAIGLYTKLGFKPAGIFPKAFLFKGGYEDEIKMVLEV